VAAAKGDAEGTGRGTHTFVFRRLSSSPMGGKAFCKADSTPSTSTTEHAVIEVQSVHDTPRRQGVQDGLDARGKQKGAQGIALLYSSGRPDHPPLNQQWRGLEGVPHPWHHGWALGLEGLQNGRPRNGIDSVFQVHPQE